MMSVISPKNSLIFPYYKFYKQTQDFQKLGLNHLNSYKQLYGDC